MPSDKCMASAASLLQGTSLCTCLGHSLHKAKKFQTKVFSFMYLHKFKMIFTASSKFWPRVKKMHLNFGTRQEADPNSSWGRYPQTKGLGKSGRAERILQSVCELGAVRPLGWHTYNGDAVSSNWHLSLPLLAGPASVPCSTVRPTGITFRFLGHSVQIHGSRT